MYFSDELFLICPHVKHTIIDAIHKHGGEVTAHYTNQVTYGLVGECCNIHGDHSDGKCNDGSTTSTFDINVNVLETSKINDISKEDCERTSANTTCTPSSFSTTDNPCHYNHNHKLCRAFPVFQSIRANRVFILYEEYITLCTTASNKLPIYNLDTDYIVYHPLLFHNVEFTTTQLPRTIKENVIAALQFMGAVYSPHLTTNTSLLIYSRLLKCNNLLEYTSLHKTNRLTNNDFDQTSSDNKIIRENNHVTEGKLSVHNKLLVALQRGVLCTTPSWVQECVRAGRLQPLHALDHNLLNKTSTQVNATDIIILQEDNASSKNISLHDKHQQSPSPEQTSFLEEEKEHKRQRTCEEWKQIEKNELNTNNSGNKEFACELEKVVNKLLKQPIPSSRCRQLWAHKSIRESNKVKSTQTSITTPSKYYASSV